MDFDGPYYIEHGDLWIRDRSPRPPGFSGLPSGRHVCRGSEEVAVCFDAEDGTLHKCGKAETVRAWADETRRRFTEIGFGEMARTLAVIAFPVTPETVAELNACSEISGRVLKLADNLSKLLDTHPELLSAPRYPAN